MRPVRGEEQQSLKVCDRVVGAVAAGAAVDDEIGIAPLKPDAHGVYCVGIVLLDGQMKDVPALRRFAEGVEVAENQVGRDPRLGAVLQPRVRRDDEVAVGRVLGQPVEASCGEYIACGHVTNSNFKI